MGQLWHGCSILWDECLVSVFHLQVPLMLLWFPPQRMNSRRNRMFLYSQKNQEARLASTWHGQVSIQGLNFIPLWERKSSVEG
jgi:hypothetical protein